MTNSHYFQRRQFLGGCAALAGTAALPAMAQSRTVRIVQGYAPGGLMDVTARIIAAAISPLIGDPVIVDSRPGASGGIASDFVADSKPDGTTILLQGLPHITNAAMGHASKWSVEDFAAVGFISRQPSILVAHSGLGIKTVKDLVAFSKKNPGAVNYMNAGNGSVSHLSMELLNHKYGAGMTEILYKGAAAGMPDLLVGRIQVASAFPLSVMPHIASGKLVPLATVDEARFSGLPDVPTIAEAGFPDALVTAKWFLLVPAKTPASILTDMSEKLRKALADPKARSQLEQQGMVVLDRSKPAEVDEFIRTSVTSWKTFFKDSGLKF